MSDTKGGSMSAVLVAEDLTVAYGGINAVRGLNIRVNEGCATALVGRNGAGKTTAMRGIMRTDGVSVSGSISVRRGSGLVQMSRPSTRDLALAGVAWVPDTRRLFPRLTVRQMLTLAAESTLGTSRAQEAVAEAVDAVPQISDLLERNSTQMSGGQQQLVAIARAFATKPAVILMDEPSEGLAPVVVDQVRNVVRGLMGGGVGVLLAEQNVDFVLDIADDVIGMVAGESAWATTAAACRGDRRLLESVVAL